MPKKICTIKDHPTLELLTNEMEATKETLLQEVEFYTNQHKELSKKMDELKDRAIAVSKEHWKKIEDYLTASGLLKEGDYDKNAGESIGLSEDKSQYEIKSPFDLMLSLIKTMKEVTEKEKEGDTTSTHLAGEATDLFPDSPKKANKDWMN